jgi:eukaryotic-like serine/threonine-protein kinase
VVFWWQRAQAKPLTDQDVLVLADFTNTTGDAEFDGALRQALAFELEESPFLKIMDDEEVNQTLQLMGRAPGERITNDIAHEVCVREGQKATIGGSIASLGKTYAIALQAINCQTGATLAREQAEDKEHVLKAVAKAATGMRAKLGESLSSIQKSGQLRQVTTTSLEALTAYQRGWSLNNQGSFQEAIQELRHAVDLDNNFAMAYQMLGIAYGNLGDPTHRKESLTKAFNLKDSVSERERLYITGTYYQYADPDLNKAIEALQMCVRSYPRDYSPHNALGVIYPRRGEYEKALLEDQEAVRLEPHSLVLIGNLMSAYMNLDRFDEAKAVAEAAFKQKLDRPSFHSSLLRIAYIQDDHAAQEREIKWFAGKPEEVTSLSMQANNALTHGRGSEAKKLFQQVDAMRAQQGLTVVASDRSWIDVDMGNCEVVLKDKPKDLYVRLLCGDPAAAKAVDEASAKNPLANPDTAFLLYRHGEFQKILDHKGRNWGEYYSLAYLGLARASVKAGDTAKAKHAYQDFLALWKDADPDAPYLSQAKKELAELH